MSALLINIVSFFIVINGHRPFWNSDLRVKSDKYIDNFRANIKGVTFSGVFTNNTVLQRGPYLSSVYGGADTSNTKVTLTISGTDSKNQPYNKVLNTNTDNNNEWKITFTEAMEAGGNYKMNIKCNGCQNPTIDDTLHGITFGDVFYCTGQSNMELDMHYTFSRNDTYNAIKQNKYQNIRYFTMWEVDTSTPTFVVPHKYNSPENRWNIPSNNDGTGDTLDKFSAPCWYFGQSLSDIYDMKDIPIGLIDVAIGGTMIEQWTKNNTIQSECSDSLCPNAMCGGLYNGMVLTFVNMTIKSYLWWQGENNMHEIPGSWLNKTGYGCMQPFMLNQWRKIWSITPGTTKQDTPFGLVTLAAGTDEGAAQQMGRFRWAQTANMDYLPNYEMTNTFVALGHDMGEPWGQGCGNQKPPICMESGKPYSFADTPQYMGPIHPRIKLPIGQRLAYAGYNMLYGNKPSNTVVSGPVISSCIMDTNSKNIVIQFNTTFLDNEAVQVIPWTAWYNKSLTVDHWSAMQVLVNNGKQWEYVDGIKTGSNKNEVIVDITSFVSKQTIITGLRYAWSTFPCCGNLNMNENPCPPDQCPIKSVMSGSNVVLPAAPFLAQIINNKCKCFEPQICG